MSNKRQAAAARFNRQLEVANNVRMSELREQIAREKSLAESRKQQPTWLRKFQR